MPIAKSTMAESIQAGVGKTAQDLEQGGFGGVFKVTCFDANGNLKWEDQFHNLVVNQGLQYLNDAFFKSLGSTYTAAWFLGLIDNVGLPSPTPYVAGDTLASHGWTELAPTVAYSGSRKSVTFGTPTTADPSVITNSASPSVFNIIASNVIAGAFLTNQSSGTSGILFSEGNFTGGTKTVANGDTVNVTYTFNADAV
jgi:hypothetical protein